jgi:hypothetical protein
MPPFFGYNERTVYVALREVYLSPPFEIFCQGFEYATKDPFFDPSLEATVAGLVGRVAFWEILPRRAGTQYPQDGVENIAWVSPGSAPAIFSLRGIWDKWFQYLPLLVCEVHALFLLPEGCKTEPLYLHFHIYEIASSERLQSFSHCSSVSSDDPP